MGQKLAQKHSITIVRPGDELLGAQQTQQLLLRGEMYFLRPE